MSSDGANFKIGEGLELPPFRALDDFILNKNRFDLPPYNDLPKWNNRIIANLLYYQTNYFAFFIIALLIQSFFNAQDIVLGTSAIVALAGIAYFAISSNPTFYQTRRDHPLATLGAIVIICYFAISVLPSIFVVAFSVLLPAFIVLLHASVRLRDFMNKVTQSVEKLGLRTTVMGQLLESCGISVRA